MRSIFIAVFLLFPTVLSAAPKDYQSILLNEPVSLLDLMVFKANTQADRFIERPYFKQSFKSDFIRYKSKYDWEKSSKNAQINFPIEARFISADFDYEKGSFYFSLYVDWSLYVIPENENNGVLKNTQKNIAEACSNILKKMSNELKFRPMTHSGYSTHGTNKLPSYEKLYRSVLKDTYYKVTIHTGDIDSELPSMSCIAVDRVDYKGSNIEYEFSGKWHELSKYENEYKRLYQ